jgi:hypothetical protein
MNWSLSFLAIRFSIELTLEVKFNKTSLNCLLLICKEEITSGLSCSIPDASKYCIVNEVPEISFRWGILSSDNMNDKLRK